MGSRIMHVIIVRKIAEKLSIEDKVPFLIGGVAPDAVPSKDTSHFFAGDLKDYSRHVDYMAFLEKYQDASENLYVLGYFTHLIADDIWLKGFYLPWLKNRMEADNEVFKRYHNDFQLLNGKLLEYYGLKDELKNSLTHIPAVIDLDEVSSKDVMEFLPSVIGDMEYDKDIVLNDKLHVFTLEQIIGYVETSVDKGVVEIRKLQSTVIEQV
ncbi:zinc dependent phospholipase C family protein [Sporosarcina highlanderae]|uniref:Zinc dependent phospholipase C family protein n=1 Tax=Sporosarcina highlanderae TaxID=3035916 RepID=A0ABT8JU25_9BACL|nr:zinc dependent phospholipase C family protein [Sporosarcina highlanderae]MDN4608658.1 zinc dependent phospholipase C family protein [Sporosarcina highlanderae]